jgi:hypothetical protein
MGLTQTQQSTPSTPLTPWPYEPHSFWAHRGSGLQRAAGTPPARPDPSFRARRSRISAGAGSSAPTEESTRPRSCSARLCGLTRPGGVGKGAAGERMVPAGPCIPARALRERASRFLDRRTYIQHASGSRGASLGTTDHLTRNEIDEEPRFCGFERALPRACGEGLVIHPPEPSGSPRQIFQVKPNTGTSGSDPMPGIPPSSPSPK